MTSPVITIVADLFDDVDQILFAAAGAGMAKAAAAIAPVFWAGVMVYVLILSISHLRGVIQEPVMDSAMRVLRVTLIGTLAINVGAYQSVIGSLIYSLPNDLVNLFMPNGARSVNGAIDTALWKGTEVSQTFLKQASGWAPVDGLGWLFMAVIVSVFTAGVCAIGAGMMLFSKVLLTIMISIGPIFIPCTLFNSTKKMFEAWMQQTINYILLFMLIAVTIGILFQLFDHSLSVAVDKAKGGWYVFIPALCIGVVCLVMFVLLPSKASALAGGVSVSAIAAAAWGMSQMRGGGRMAGALRPNAIRRAWNPGAPRGLRGDVMALDSMAKGAGMIARRVYAPPTGGSSGPAPKRPQGFGPRHA